MENTLVAAGQESTDVIKVVIITGANGNLGSAVTRTCLAKGYRVIATVLKENMKDSIEKADNLEVHAVDLGNEEDAGVFIANAIEKYNRIDAILMLVGGFAAGDINSATGADIRQQFALNFETAYFVARPAFTHMLEQNNGRLVFIGARPALNPAQGKDLLAYALSKSSLFKLAEFLNESAKEKNVTASVVVPSTLDTPLNRKSMPGANFDDWVKPEKLAELLAFLISDTGSILRETVLKAYNNA